MPEIGTVQVSEPVECESGYFFIALDRVEGIPLEIGDRTCSAGDACEGLGANPIFEEVAQQLIAEGIAVHEVGRGACGEVGDDFAGWNYSLSVYEWESAAPAVGALADALAAHNVSGHVGVTVRGPACTIPLAG